MGNKLSPLTSEAEEAAANYVIDLIDVLGPASVTSTINAFVAGARWSKEESLKCLERDREFHELMRKIKEKLKDA